MALRKHRLEAIQAMSIPLGYKTRRTKKTRRASEALRTQQKTNRTGLRRRREYCDWRLWPWPNERGRRRQSWRGRRDSFYGGLWKVRRRSSGLISVLPNGPFAPRQSWRGRRDSSSGDLHGRCRKNRQRTALLPKLPPALLGVVLSARAQPRRA